MEPSELADRLESRWVDSNSTEEDEIIVKSLRFAADMEKLLNHEKTLSVISTREDPDVVVAVKTMDGVKRFNGTDIYSAARKAVEALEGK